MKRKPEEEDKASNTEGREEEAKERRRRQLSFSSYRLLKVHLLLDAVGQLDLLLPLRKFADAVQTVEEAQKILETNPQLAVSTRETMHRERQLGI
jgi:hypothetical protein